MKKLAGTALVFIAFALTLIALALVVGKKAGAEEITKVTESSRHDYLEHDLRVAAIRFNAQREACKLPGARLETMATCYSRANANWRKANALARARFVDTPAAWAEVSRITREEDERTAKVERMTQ